MSSSERALLIEHPNNNTCLNQQSATTKLSLAVAVICIVDVFGVFPMITLPKTVVDCGLSGILVVIIVCCAQMFTAILLGNCWQIAETVDPTIQYKNRYPYSAISEMTYGKSMSKFVTCLLDLTVFGGGIPNIIVAAQNLQLLGLRMSDGSFELSYCYWMIVMGTILCPFLWFGSPKDMKLLCSISTALVLSVFVLVLSSIVSDSRTDFPPPPSSPNENSAWGNILTAYGVIAFQFDIHPTILNIQVDMRDKNQLGRAVIGGFSLSLATFVIVCTTVALKYGTAIEDSVMDTLPSSFGLHICALLVALQLGLTSAISNTALYQHVEDCTGIPREFNYRRCLLRTTLAFLSVLVAESVPKFEVVMSLIGCALTGPLVFILPPLFYIKMLSLKREHEKKLLRECFDKVICNAGEPSEIVSRYMETKFYEDIEERCKKKEEEMDKAGSIFKRGDELGIGLCVVIIVFGSCGTLAATYVNVVSAIDSMTFSPPCIYRFVNITGDSV